MQIVPIIIGEVILAVLVGFICLLLFEARMYLRDRSAYYISQMGLTAAEEISAKISATAEFLEVIRALINNSVEDVLQPYTQLNKKYEVMKIDEDIVKVSTRVYSSISDYVLTSGGLMLMNEYIMDFIITEVRLALVDKVTEFNNRILLS